MTIQGMPHIVPQHRASLADQAAAMMVSGSGQTAYVWMLLAPRLIHPLKVGIMEALLYMEQPLSASELTALFDDPDCYLGLVAYHLKGLAAAGIVEAVHRHQGRGALEQFFYFPTPAAA